MVLSLELKKTFNCRLRMDFGVVFLDDRPGYAFQSFRTPVDLEPASNRVHKAFVSLESFERTGDAALRKKSGMKAAGCSIWISKPFPVRQCACARDTKRVEGRAANGDGIGSSQPVKTERARYSSCDRVRALGRMIEALVADRRHIAQPALDL